MPKCIISGCTSGSKNNRPNFSFFKPPPDEVRFEKWQRSVPMKDREITRKDSVCSVHFTSDMIEHFYTYQINGETVQLLRGKPILSKDAYPCIFPSLPSHYTNPPPIRKAPKERRSSPQSEMVIKTEEQEKEEEEIIITGFVDFVEQLDKVNLPSPQWGRHVHLDKRVVAFTHFRYIDDGKTVVDKVISINEFLEPSFSNQMATATAPRACMSKVGTIRDAELMLNYMENNRVCSGFTNEKQRLNEDGNEIRTRKQCSKKCTVFLKSESAIKQCAQCVIVQKRLARSAALQTRKAFIFADERKHMRRQIRRLQQQVEILRDKLAGINDADSNADLKMSIDREEETESGSLDHDTEVTIYTTE